MREKEFIGYAQGNDRAYLEFAEPAPDRGTRFLKLGDAIWIPRVGKAIKLAGHMLRQSPTGSDFSCSDAASNRQFLEQYSAELVGTDTVMGLVEFQLDVAVPAGVFTTYYLER